MDAIGCERPRGLGGRAIGLLCTSSMAFEIGSPLHLVAISCDLMDRGRDLPYGWRTTRTILVSFLLRISRYRRSIRYNPPPHSSHRQPSYPMQ